ncbi:FusB/FusC family EF-G-binding protein [Mammaliicoccus stepanovicii]|uniref:Fibronectin-binding protein n=1 Tax=Mammaliicoccus stepanovicii TaxID=643214 RepID=A0A240A452_9STAP|nr:FusB/FusC family EF-G-binding protein [Mammaliicoccus stepanovicii]PNZ71928.1 elongation factor G-binding protein [Mammaliicoccus stepanovicii]GGI39429.1 elongation factor G-binding protein [Mammaliicoccus stepanovicii]SNV77854.1 fibronectin-binding protein [Mammaliicoccus stepanovicii]
MNNFIQPYQFVSIKEQAEKLVNVYKSVNDPKTIETFQAMTDDHIAQLFNEKHSEVTDFVNIIMNKKISRAQVDKLLIGLKAYVIPFEQPSSKQLEKVFKKTKKLKQPDWENIDLKESSYIGWNDSGKQKKYIVLYDENEKLTGVVGDLSPAIKPGICSICQKESNVSMFLSTTKSKGDGTYTKNGNYICHDSIRCNQQLVQLDALYDFIHTVKMT